MRVYATHGSNLEMTEMVLNYAMQKWRSVPSPQGFTFGCATMPELEPDSYEPLDMGEFDGGAVLLRRDKEPECVSGTQGVQEARSQTTGK